MLLGSSVTSMLLWILFDISESKKSKMSDTKPEVPVPQLVNKISTATYSNVFDVKNNPTKCSSTFEFLVLKNIRISVEI